MIRAGLPISLTLHAGVIFGASLAFSTVEPLEEGRVVPVEIITVGELTDIQASLQRETPPPEPDPEPELPMQVETSVENAPDVDDVVNITPDEETTS
ncbi:MAG: hypothetical protein AAFP97_09580, partial [Pseudomonadota bacterium]